MKIEKSSNYVSRTSRDYSVYVCSTRAIPAVTDGLKDGQRKSLWLIRNKVEKIKTVSLSGVLIAENIYSHSDTSASETISAMAAPYINNVTYFEGIGTFGGKLTPRAWGAPRYTYVKKNSDTENLIFQDLDIVPLMENYDGSNFSAKTFLPLVPIVLLNGISGVAVGWSTEILPHNLLDIIDNCLLALDDKELTKLKPFYQKYDLDIENIEDNSWYLNGKVSIKDKSTVKITEIPPQIKVEKFREYLDKLEEEGKIISYVDKSSRNIEIEVNFRRGALLDLDTNEKLINFFKLKTKITERIVVIDWNGENIKTYTNGEELTKDFIKWRLEWYSKRYQHFIDKINEEIPYYKILLECFENNLPSVLQELQSKKELTDIITEFANDISHNIEHINKIVSLPSYKWTKDSYEENKKKLEELENQKEEYQKILDSDAKMKNIYKKELLELRKKYS